MNEPARVRTSSWVDWTRLANPFGADAVTQGLASGAVGSLALKVSYSLLTFVLGVLLARSLGSTGYGAYVYAMSWAVFLGVPAALGLDTLVVRDVAVWQRRSEWGRIRGLLRAANRAGLGASLALAGAAAVTAWLIAHGGSRQALTTFCIAQLMVPAFTLMKVRQAALAGLHRVVLGQVPEFLLQPLLLVALLAVGWGLIGGIDPPTAMAMTVASSCVALALGAWFLRRNLPIVHERPTIVSLPWRQSLLPLIVMASLQIVQSQMNMLLLGALRGPRSVGIYGAASRGALLVGFFLNTVTPVLAPAIASLHAARDTATLERVMIRSARITLLLALPVAVGLIGFGRWYLLLFGPDFTEGRTALAILAIGQLLSVAMGSVAWFMLMTGHEADAVRSVAVAATVNAALCLMLIPRWDLEGAAVAATVSTILWNALLVGLVHKRLGIHCTALGVPGGARSRP